MRPSRLDPRVEGAWGTRSVVIAPAAGIRLLGWLLAACWLNDRVPAVLRARCAFQRVTRLPCPFCDASSSARALLRGRVSTSVRANPLPIVAAIGIGILSRSERGEIEIPYRAAGTVLAATWALQLGRHLLGRANSGPQA